MSHYHFDASDGYGRIRVELSAGYVDMNQFIKLFNVVNFTFQHVPTGETKTSFIHGNH